MKLHQLTDCNLVVADEAWAFATDYAGAIEQYWIAEIARNPKSFNGDVFVVDQWSIADGVLMGTSLPTKFAAYLYWRDGVVNQAGFSEAFATTVISAWDGGVLLARNVAGTLNGGRFGSPGGLLDARDIGPGGRLDLKGAADRELFEETGLKADEMKRQGGFLLAHVPPFLALASVFRSDMTGSQLLERVEGFLAEQLEPELEFPVIVRDVAELDALETTPFAQLLTTYALDMARTSD